MIDLYQHMTPEMFAEDFEPGQTLAQQILSKIKKGSLRDIFFASMLIEDLAKEPYKGSMVKTQVLEWGPISHISNITPYGMVEPEWKLEKKYGRTYLNDQPKDLHISFLEGNFQAHGIYDRLEKSLYMSNFNALLNISPAMIVYAKTDDGLYGWRIKEVEMPEDLLFALAYAQKNNYGGIIRGNVFYPTPQSMYDETSILMNAKTPLEQERYQMFLRAKNFYRLAGNFQGKVADYKEEDDNLLSPEETKIYLPRGFFPDIKNDTMMDLLQFIVKLLSYRPQGSFIIYKDRDFWRIRKSKYFQPGDRLITYALVDDKRLKVDVNLGKYFYDPFLTKNYLYNVYKVRDEYVLIR